MTAIYLVRVPVVDPASPLTGNMATSARQVVIPSQTLGKEAYEIYSQFVYEDNYDENILANVIDQFEQYCNPRQNILHEWYSFWNFSQGDGETVDTFMKRLKTQDAKCEFSDLQKKILLCRLLFELSSE